jgi:hypothetical protein
MCQTTKKHVTQLTKRSSSGLLRCVHFVASAQQNFTAPIYEYNQQDALIYYSKTALHVSGDVFAHHQEHMTVFTVSGSSPKLLPAVFAISRTRLKIAFSAGNETVIPRRLSR